MKKLKAVKYAYSIFACALIAFGLAVLIKGWFPAEPFMLFGGLLMIGFGAVRILGYFSKDALQLAFQFDLFLGIASAVLGCYMIWDTQAAGHIVMVLGVFFLIDALSKVQTAIDARRIGVERWGLILGMALAAATLGALVVLTEFQDLDIVTRLIGASLAVDGVLNLYVTQSTVNTIRRKKAWEA